MNLNKVKIIKLKIIKNSKGDLLKYLDRTNKYFKQFGEIYFNHIKLKKTKGWNYHRKNTCLLICVWGKVKFHFVDKNGKERKIILDSKLGKNVNIGAGTITCNYDGVKKFKTKISDNIFIGSNSSLVAPISINKNSVVGAGSVITKNVKKKSLALTRASQIEIKNYKRKKK